MDWLTSLLNWSSDQLDPVGPGTWPDWIAGLSTTAAVLWGVFLFRVSVRDAKKSQPRLVHPYFENSEEFEELDPGNGSSASLDRTLTDATLLLPENPQFIGDIEVTAKALLVGIVIENNSDEIITNIRGGAVSLDPGRDDLHFPRVPAIGPKKQELGVVLFRESGIADRNALPYEPWMQFRDAVGREWLRYTTKPVRRLRSKRFQFWRPKPPA